jgi:protein SCO1/2
MTDRPSISYWKALSRCSVGLVLLLLIAIVPASAHTLDDVQRDLFEREQYFQIVNEPATEFTLQDADGNPVSLSDFRGKAVVLHFIYTNCPDFCPLHAEKIAEIQERVNLGPDRERVQFISITTDPSRDTPDILREYGPLHGLDSVNWAFLTSGPEQPEDATRTVAEAYGLEFTEVEDEIQLHGVVTFVIDREGWIRGKFHGLDFDPTNAAIYINALLNDHPHPEAAFVGASEGASNTLPLILGGGAAIAGAAVAFFAWRFSRRGPTQSPAKGRRQ